MTSNRKIGLELGDGRNPWRAPASEARVAQGQRLARRSHAAASSAFMDKDRDETEGVAGTTLASDIDADATELVGRIS
jgi:hypothetical protein